MIRVEDNKIVFQIEDNPTILVQCRHNFKPFLPAISKGHYED
jgi:hypothetical protein